MTLGSEAAAIIGRLAAVDFKHPVIDQDRANRALAKHFRALRLSPLPIRWVSDAEAGYIAAGAAAAAWAPTGLTVKTAVASAAWTATWAAAWTATKAGAESAAAAWTATWAAAWRATKAGAESAAAAAAWAETGAVIWTAAESAAWAPTGAAAWAEAKAATWAAVAQAADKAKIGRYITIWLPFVDALEAGLWLFWVLETEVLAVPRPTLRIRRNQLHCAEGPAVRWSSGVKYYFLNGVKVPDWLVLTPAEAIDPRFLLREHNAGVRREIVRKVGIERICGALVQD